MRRYAQVSGTFLGLIAIAHLARAYLQVPLVVADYSVPNWMSVCAFVGTGALAVWAFRVAKGGA